MTGPDTTLAEIHAFFREHAEDGVSCPACGQRVQVYWRSLNSEMAWVAIRLFLYSLENGDSYAYMPAIFGGEGIGDRYGWAGGDYAKLRYWGCLEELAGIRDDGSSRVGHWRITELGKQWVTGMVMLPRYVRVFNNQPMGPPTPYSKSGKYRDPVGIRDALGSNFDFDALMRGEGLCRGGAG